MQVLGPLDKQPRGLENIKTHKQTKLNLNITKQSVGEKKHVKDFVHTLWTITYVHVASYIFGIFPFGFTGD